ncbi:hypothetical protein ES703_66344 [subsurface metagenome]
MGELNRYGKGMISVLNEGGDSRIEWDPENDKEIEAAEEMFNKTIEIDGMKAYELGKDGEQGKEIKKFNPNAAKIIMVPRIAGG